MENSGKIQKPKEFSETRKIMLSFTCLLSALSVLSVYSYGVRALAVILISVITTTVCKKVCEEIAKSDYPHGDLSGLVTGLMVALLMPASVPLYIPVLTCIFAVLVCMLPFGTAKNSPFVPAVAAVCFAILCFGEDMFAYPQLLNGILETNEAAVSLTALLTSGTAIKLNSAVVLKIITGQLPSAMGTGFVIMLLGALAFMLIRYTRNALPSVAFIISASLFALIFPRVHTGAVTSFTMEICGGMLLFSAIFFMSYPAVLPTRLFSSIVWGFVSGIVCMLFRHFGKFEESVLFGILIMNATASLFDELPLTKFEKKKLDDSTPYEETTPEPVGVVPAEILDEIPDMSDEEIIAQEVEGQNEAITQETLHEAFNAENEIDETTDTPFNMGGDGNEQ